jgi:hypothetical protein
VPTRRRTTIAYGRPNGRRGAGARCSSRECKRSVCEVMARGPNQKARDYRGDEIHGSSRRESGAHAGKSCRPKGYGSALAAVRYGPRQSFLQVRMQAQTAHFLAQVHHPSRRHPTMPGSTRSRQEPHAPHS